MEAFSWLLYTVSLLATLALLSKTFSLRRKVHLPPGPKPWPIIGNFNLIGALPHRSIYDLSKKYGPLMHIKLGSKSVVVASSVEMAKEFLKTNDSVFAGRPNLAAGKYLNYNYSDMVWSQYGPYWRQARKLFLTELFSPKRIEFSRYIRVEERQLLIHDLYNVCGETVSIRDHISDMNLSIISRIVLGKKYTVKKENVTDPSVTSVSEFKGMLDEWFLLSGVLNIGDYIPWLGFLDLQGYVKRMKVASKKFDRFLEHVVDEHNQKRHAAKDWEAKDMVDVLLQAADSELEVKLDRASIKAFTLDLLAGGTESSSLTVEWAMAELLKSPRVILKATEELDRVIGRDRWVDEKDLPQLPFIEAIMKETMRLHPMGPLLSPRQTREDCKINGFEIPAGTQGLVCTWSISRDPTIWEKPEEFYPERFIGNKIDVKGSDFELLPFGAGRRMCPGYSLGRIFILSNLANLLHGFSWNLPGDQKPQDLDMEENFGLSIPKKNPVLAVPQPRLPTHLYYK